MRDISEKIDEYCLDTYGHTNWGYLSTYNKDELKNNDHDIEDNIVFWHDDIEDESEE